jgi:threonine dehydrogenase-like Zn-dependent dehydrogenase
MPLLQTGPVRELSRVELAGIGRRGIYGYSHTAGGYDGGQAEYVRVPYADVGPLKIPKNMHLDDAVLLTDVVPTGYQAAEMGGIKRGDTVVVFGAGRLASWRHAALGSSVLGESS